VAPTIALGWTGELAPDKRGMARALKQAGVWQEHDLKPDWTGDWKDAVFRYRGSDGARVVVENTKTGIRCVSGSDTIYQRVKGVSRVSTPLYVDGWRAYDENTLFGLDPKLEYWLDDAPRPDGIHLSRLSDNAILTGSHVTDSFALFDLTSVEPALPDLIALFPQARTGTIFEGRDKPLDWAAAAGILDVQSGGQARKRCTSTRRGSPHRELARRLWSIDSRSPRKSRYWCSTSACRTRPRPPTA